MYRAKDFRNVRVNIYCLRISCFIFGAVVDAFRLLFHLDDSAFVSLLRIAPSSGGGAAAGDCFSPEHIFDQTKAPNLRHTPYAHTRTRTRSNTMRSDAMR